MLSVVIKKRSCHVVDLHTFCGDANISQNTSLTWGTIEIATYVFVHGFGIDDSTCLLIKTML